MDFITIQIQLSYKQRAYPDADLWHYTFNGKPQTTNKRIIQWSGYCSLQTALGQFQEEEIESYEIWGTKKSGSPHNEYFIPPHYKTNKLEIL